jgi:hypothetical protein
MITQNYNDSFIGKSAADIIAGLKRQLVPELLREVSAAESGILALYGSGATGALALGSDLDLMLFLPAQVLKSNNKGLMSLSELWWQNYGIDLSSAYSLEQMSSDRVWNDDFLLTVLWQAAPVYDPSGLFLGIKQRFIKFPPEVRREKIISAGWEIIRLLARLDKHQKKGDILEAASARIKILKLGLTLLHLKDNKFINSNNIYLSAKQNLDMSHWLPLVDGVLANLQNSESDEFLLKLVDQIQEAVVKEKILPPDFFTTWRPWLKPLKYKVNIKGL